MFIHVSGFKIQLEISRRMFLDTSASSASDTRSQLLHPRGWGFLLCNICNTVVFALRVCTHRHTTLPQSDRCSQPHPDKVCPCWRSSCLCCFGPNVDSLCLPAVSEYLTARVFSFPLDTPRPVLLCVSRNVVRSKENA